MMFLELPKKGFIYNFAQNLENRNLKKAIQDYSLHYFSIENEINYNQNTNIFQNINESSVVIIDHYPRSESISEDNHFIISFKKTIILIKDPNSIIQQLFKINNKIEICFLYDTKKFFDDKNKNEYHELINNDFFNEELYKFINHFTFLQSCDFLREIREIICPCISAYFIKESYFKLNTNRIDDFYSNQSINERTINEDEYIELRIIGSGSLSIVYLVYHIEDEKLYVIKKQSTEENDEKFEKIKNREIENYRKINHPCFPRFYGLTQKNKNIVFEYINGQTLNNTDISKYSESEKYSIINQILIIFKYLHDNNFIYRDLKPNNIIIDSNKIAVLIDFDRMINNSSINYENNSNVYTNNFISEYAAPEINSGHITNKCDIYSIGKIISFIINNKNPMISLGFIPELNQCFEIDLEKRPTIMTIIYKFYLYCHNKNIIFNNTDANSNITLAEMNLRMNKINDAIKYYTLAANQNDVRAQLSLGNIYFNGKYIERDIKKAIHYYSLAANQNHPQALYNLGNIYFNGNYIERDIKKAIQYYSLAANQNDPQAQNDLGVIYLEGKYIEQDINKSIHYYTLAANQNDPQAQNNLGVIYYEGKHVMQDINKAMYYYSCAANQNNSESQYKLGLIYSEGKYVTQDINKAIYYYSCAANQNNSEALFNLADIYLEGKYFNIEKAIHYYSLAAKLNHPQAQHNLGLIYLDGRYTIQDVNQSIYYFSLAAKQNCQESQYNLGHIYLEGIFITRDINKAIYYYSLAANQNYPPAQNRLGIIYLDGKYIERDIKKAIHYFQLAADQNYQQALHNLANIYSEGKFVTRDINKAIHYYTILAFQNVVQAQYSLGIIYSENKYINRDIKKAILYFEQAANQNHLAAQYSLGIIYYDGNGIVRDINKSIYYYSLAADQNYLPSQNNLALIYLEGEYIKRDIKKAIHYFQLAAKHNHPPALNNLGAIYYEDKYIERDINKSIHYLTLAANQNDIQAQNNLGFIYLEGKYVTQDINKAFHYFSFAAKQNFPQAQFILGFIYYNFLNKTRNNIDLGISWILESEKYNNINAYFFLGFLYHEGKNIKQDIKKSIHYYKEASNYNNQYAKNNLGIIYKHGIYNEIGQNYSFAVEYFTESIKQKNDKVSMYNLAHLYIYEQPTNESIDKSINLLIDSLNLGFYQSAILLVIILFKKHERNFEYVKKDLHKLNKKVYNHIFNETKSDLFKSILSDEKKLEEYYLHYRSIDFLYNQSFEIIETNHLYYKKNHDSQKTNKGKCINQDFYIGFGCQI